MYARTKGSRQSVARAAIPALAESFGLTNEFGTDEGHPADAIAFLRRVNAVPADLADDALLHTNVIVHVASATDAIVAGFCAEVIDLLGPSITLQVLNGVVRPTNFTGNAMHDFAYANQLTQQPGMVAPNAFFIPMSKTSEWWAKDWMERHTYFLPRYNYRR